MEKGGGGTAVTKERLSWRLQLTFICLLVSGIPDRVSPDAIHRQLLQPIQCPPQPCWNSSPAHHQHQCLTRCFHQLLITVFVLLWFTWYLSSQENPHEPPFPPQKKKNSQKFAMLVWLAMGLSHPYNLIVNHPSLLHLFCRCLMMWCPWFCPLCPAGSVSSSSTLQILQDGSYL